MFFLPGHRAGLFVCAFALREPLPAPTLTPVIRQSRNLERTDAWTPAFAGVTTKLTAPKKRTDMSEHQQVHAMHETESIGHENIEMKGRAFAGKAASGSSEDVALAFDEFMRAFEAFKEENDARLAQIEQNISEDVVTPRSSSASTARSTSTRRRSIG